MNYLPARRIVARRVVLVVGALGLALAGWSAHSRHWWSGSMFQTGESGMIRYELDEAGRPARIIDGARVIDLRYDRSGNLVWRGEN